MNIKGWTGIVGVAVLTAGWLVSGQLQAATAASDGYTLEDFRLRTAADLVDVCTLGKAPNTTTILFPGPPRTISLSVPPQRQRARMPLRSSLPTFVATRSMLRTGRLMRSSVH